MKRLVLLFLFLISLSALNAQSFSRQQLADTLTIFANRYANVLKVNVKKMQLSGNSFRVETNENLSYIPFRPENVVEIKSTIQKMLGMPNAQINIITDGKRIEELIPNMYLPKEQQAHKYKLPQTTALVTNKSLTYSASNGLEQKHIALWGSHGYHYDQQLKRWEWQRARLMQTVEDLFTSSYTMPYLVPMLENAGAIVLQPRERDTQLNEIIVDNDNCENQDGFKTHNQHYKWKEAKGVGFCNDKKVYAEGENPFTMGSYHIVATETDSNRISEVEWKPRFEAEGEYAVYITYKTLPESTTDAQYAVHHAGGVTYFSVNQTMGGSTWIYLGTFTFLKGNNHKVTLNNYSKEKEKTVTADAIRFGGGMGNIARKPASCTFSDYEISGYPRFMEGARYYLQWAGIPDSVYNFTEGKNDYTDDFSCRGRWVNYLAGGSVSNPKKPGLNIPLQLALAFHSDAGVTSNDSIVGTLTIYTALNNDKKPTFPAGVVRYNNNRNLADIIQTEIVNDIKATLAPEWQRRAMFNKSYSETRNPEVPSVILELLSHQNLADMRYGLDPNFKFITCRAVYKGILKYTHLQYNTEYVVQPLPINSFALLLAENNQLKLSWQSTIDPLEPTAQATQYVVYTKINDGGFDNGILVNANEHTINIETGKHYSFKVAAANAGGISLPSETLSAYIAPNSKGTALIINGFDRVSAPESFAVDSTLGGFIPNRYGIAYGYDIAYAGEQYEFKRSVPWQDDDAPGFGGSYANFEHEVTAGNTFNYPHIHGKAIAKMGYSYISSSVAAIDTATIQSNFKFIDVILGKQKQTRIGTLNQTILYKTFPNNLQDALIKYAKNKGNILVSGAYIASDLWEDTLSTVLDRKFAENILHYTWRTNYASQSGQVSTIPNSLNLFNTREKYSYYTLPNAEKYAVESPDGIEAFGANTQSIMRYTDNNITAGIAHKSNYKTCVLGFPIEALKTQNEIDKLMEGIIRFFEN